MVKFHAFFTSSPNFQTYTLKSNNQSKIVGYTSQHNLLLQNHTKKPPDLKPRWKSNIKCKKQTSTNAKKKSLNSNKKQQF